MHVKGSGQQHDYIQSVLTYGLYYNKNNRGFRLQPWMCLFWNKELHLNEVPISS